MADDTQQFATVDGGVLANAAVVESGRFRSVGTHPARVLRLGAVHKEEIPANEQDCAQVGELAQQVQTVTGESVTLVFVDQGYTGEHNDKRLNLKVYNRR